MDHEENEDLITGLALRQSIVQVYNPDSLTDIFDAVTWGDLAQVVHLVKNELSRQTFMNLASSLLHLAVSNRHPSVLEFILSNKAYVDCRDANMTTPLMVAANKGDIECLQILLAYSADVNALDYDLRCPLYFAAYDGHIDCVNTLLVQSNLDLSIIRKGGWTPLHEAARFGHEDVVEALIFHGADIMAKTEDACWTPGHMAASSGRTKCLELLIDAGINVNAMAGPDKSSTLLHEACHKGHDPCVKLLLASGADLLRYNVHDLPHHEACKYGHASTLDILLTHHEEQNKRDPGHEKLVDMFTKVETEEDGGNYNNALHLAAYYGRLDCVQVLLQHGAKSVPNGMERTPEILAVSRLHQSSAAKSIFDCIKLLLANLQSKKDIIAERRKDESDMANPLYFLCRSAHKVSERTIACACLLLNSGLVSVSNNCLDAAVRGGALPLVELLLSSGADPYQCEVIRGSTQQKKRDMCIELVDEARTEPKSLLLCARITIRKLVEDSHNGMQCVNDLPLPRMLKDYVYHGHYNVGGLCNV